MWTRRRSGPCGYHTDPKRECRCTPGMIQKYMSKISGPLLDRIDLHVEVSRLSHDELLAAPDGESSASILERVVAARKIQSGRFKELNFYCNAGMSSKDMQKFCKIGKQSELLLRHARLAAQVAEPAAVVYVVDQIKNQIGNTIKGAFGCGYNAAKS